MSHRSRAARVLWALLLGLLVPRASGNAVLDWNAVMMAAIRIDNTGPTLSTRNLAILHLAIYDAVNSITRDHQPYRFQPTAPALISLEAAVAGAGYQVIQSLYPSVQAEADDTFDTWLASVALDSSLTNGLQLVTLIAQRRLAERSDDGASTEVPYIIHRTSDGATQLGSSRRCDRVLGGQVSLQPLASGHRDSASR